MLTCTSNAMEKKSNVQLDSTHKGAHLCCWVAARHTACPLQGLPGLREQPQSSCMGAITHTMAGEVECRLPMCSRKRAVAAAAPAARGLQLLLLLLLQQRCFYFCCYYMKDIL